MVSAPSSSSPCRTATARAGGANTGSSQAREDQRHPTVEPGQFGDALDNFVNSLASLDLNGAIRGVGDVLSAGLDGIGSFLTGLGDALGIPALVTAGSAVSDVASSVYGFFDVAADVVSGAVSDAVQAMSDATGAVAGAIADGIGLVVDAVVGFFQSLFGSGEGQQAPLGGQGGPGPGEPAPAPGDSGPGPGEPAPQPDNPPGGDTSPPAPAPGDSSSADTGDLGGGATGGTGPGFGAGGADLTPGGVGAGGALGIGGRRAGQPAGGFGSGDVDPVDTALGHVALTMQAGLRNAAAAARAASVPGDDGGPGGGGPAEPGTGGPAGTGGGRAGSFGAVTGSSVDLSQLAQRFNVDPNPEQLQAAFGRAARWWCSLGTTTRSPGSGAP